MDDAETSEPESEATGVSSLRVTDIRQHDWFLAKLVNWTNVVGMEAGITLNVGGATITGVTISGHEYFDLFHKSFMGGLKKGTQVGDQLRTEIDGVLESYKSAAAIEPRPTPMYIHLKDAKIFSSGGGSPIAEGLLWRGKIDAVDGFTLGALRRE